MKLTKTQFETQADTLQEMLLTVQKEVPMVEKCKIAWDTLDEKWIIQLYFLENEYAKGYEIVAKDVNYAINSINEFKASYTEFKQKFYN